MLKNFALLGSLIVAGGFPTSSTWAKASVSERAPPALKSISPLGGNQGSNFAATVRGENLDAAYHVWFDCQGLSAAIEAIREIDPDESEEKPYPPPAPDAKKLERKLYELRLRVVVAANAQLGAHEMRLVTPLGVTDALSVLVDSVRVVLETDQSHSIQAQAQHLAIPAVVNARLAESGEVDYYSFDVEAGQGLQLEVRTTYFPDLTELGDPQLVLFKPEGSWFDPHRGVRLEVADLWRPPPGDSDQITYHRLPRVRRVFDESGRYLARVDTVGGQSGPDYSYQLKIFEINRTKRPNQERWGPLFRHTRVARAHGPDTISAIHWDRTGSICSGLEVVRLPLLRARSRSQAKPSPMTMGHGRWRFPSPRSYRVRSTRLTTPTGSSLRPRPVIGWRSRLRLPTCHRRSSIRGSRCSILTGRN